MRDQSIGVITGHSTTERGARIVQSIPASLRQSVREFLRQLLMQWVTPINYYDLVLAEVEAPMLHTLVTIRVRWGAYLRSVEERCIKKCVVVAYYLIH